MSAPTSHTTASRALASLGITELEERAYHLLLAQHRLSAAELASQLDLPARKTQHLLDALAAKGLISCSPERPRRYLAAPPEFALEALACQRQAEIERARALIPQLKQRAPNPTDIQPRNQVVELITGIDALRQTVVQMLQSAETEILGFERAPTWGIHVFPSDMHERVRVRNIADAGYLALPGSLEKFRMDMEKGEEVRVFPVLPVKMMIMDRRFAIIPLDVDHKGGAVMLLKSCALLDSLCALFELVWEKSTPISLAQSGEWAAETAAPQLSEAARRVIPLLSVGLNDKAIADEAGISQTTLNRRIAELMKSYGTRTRFQLGWRAALEAFPERTTVKAP